MIFVHDAKSQVQDSIVKKIEIKSIILEGNKKTNDDIILRELNIGVGDSIVQSKMDEVFLTNKQRLLNLPLFTYVEVLPIPVDQHRIDVLIRVKERWYIMPELSFKLADRNLNVWIKEHNMDLRRANIGATIKHFNAFGNMEQLGLILQLGYVQRLGLSFEKPYIDRQKKHGIGGNIIYSRTQEVAYATKDYKLQFAKNEQIYLNKRIEGQLGYTYRPKYASKHRVFAGFNHYEVGDTIIHLNPEYFYNGSKKLSYLEAGYRFDYNGVNNWNYPLKGLKVVFNASHKLGLTGMKHLTRLHLEATKFEQLSNKWYGSLGFRGRLSFPVNQPYVNNAALGYDLDYLRGYEYYVIDGAHFGIVKSTIKYELLNVAIKHVPVPYLPVIPIKIYPKAYFDFGAVSHGAILTNLNNRLLYSGGIGVDIVTAYDFKVKIEWSWNQFLERDLYLHQSGD